MKILGSALGKVVWLLGAILTGICTVLEFLGKILWKVLTVLLVVGVFLEALQGPPSSSGE